MNVVRTPCRGEASWSKSRLCPRVACLNGACLCTYSRSTAMGATRPDSAWSRSRLKHATERTVGSRVSAADPGRLSQAADGLQTIRAAWSRAVRQDGPDPGRMSIGVDARETDPATIRASWHADEAVHTTQRGTPGLLRPRGLELHEAHIRPDPWPHSIYPSCARGTGLARSLV